MEAYWRERALAAEKRLESAEFWVGVYPDGWNPARLKNEMHDFHVLMDGMSKLYDHITGGAASNPNTDKEVIMALHDDHFNEEVDEYVNEAYDIAAGCVRALAGSKWVSIEAASECADEILKLKKPKEISGD